LPPFHVLLQLQLTRTSPGHKRYIRLYSKDDCLLLRVSQQGDIGFRFQGGSTNHIARRSFCFASGLPVGNNSLLLAIHEVGMNPHDLSLRSKNRYDTFLSLVVWICIDHPEFSFRDGSYSGRHWRLYPILKEWCHVSCHFLLLPVELEHLRINQSLENVFEDITALDRVPQHPVVQAVIGVVNLAHLLRTLAFGSFSLLLLLSNLTNESTCSL